MSSSAYKKRRLSLQRRMAAASAKICHERNTIYTVAEVDITIPRNYIKQHQLNTGTKLSLTAYVVSTLARAVSEFPDFNALTNGRNLYVLNDITIGTLVERKIEDEMVPEPFGIQKANTKTVSEIHKEIRDAQSNTSEKLGSLSGASWVRFIPSFLFRTMIRLASRNVMVAKKYGVITVTSVGMFSKKPFWLLPLSATTISIAIGGIARLFNDGEEYREILCITIGFDHDIIDGAPAARFTSRFMELLESGAVLL